MWHPFYSPLTLLNLYYTIPSLLSIHTIMSNAGPDDLFGDSDNEAPPPPPPAPRSPTPRTEEDRAGSPVASSSRASPRPVQSDQDEDEQDKAVNGNGEDAGSPAPEGDVDDLVSSSSTCPRGMTKSADDFSSQTTTMMRDHHLQSHAADQLLRHLLRGLDLDLKLREEGWSMRRTRQR